MAGVKHYVSLVCMVCKHEGPIKRGLVASDLSLKGKYVDWVALKNGDTGERYYVCPNCAGTFSNPLSTKGFNRS
jgi:hypothetical protein